MTSETVEAIEVALGRFAVARSPLRRVLLAVSGGPDSLALLLACAGRSLPVDVRVATVDHGLRPEAADEATFVADLCRDLGLPHRTLVWREAASARGNLMEAAREARYRLLAGHALRIGAGAILTAHHADDQLETHLLARARGAKGANLAGMRAWRDLEPDLVLLRPFLALSKRMLEDSIAGRAPTPVRDPSNDDARFHRVRHRQELARGVHDIPALETAIAAAARLRDADDAALAAAIDDACGDGRLRVEQDGSVAFRPDGEGAALWSRLVTAAGGAARPPDRTAVERLRSRFTTGDIVAATLAGCRVARGTQAVLLSREFGRSGPAPVDVGPGELASFDRRFDLSGLYPPGAARIEPMGRLGLGGPAQRALPVCVDGKGALLAVHPALEGRFADCPVLTLRQRVGWRIRADLPGRTPPELTAEPQNAANPFKAVGKDLAATYLRGRV